MNKTRFLVPILLMLAAVVFAQQNQTSLPSGFRGDFLRQMADVEKKMVDLAQAIPAEKYSWRPEDGVRSFGEVYVHIATGNFLIPQFVGIQPPAGIKPDMEKTVTERSKIVPLLQQSFDHLRKGVLAMSDSQLAKPANFFGDQTTVEDVLFRIANHQHEHLGQLIAYARMNKITPPWSASAGGQ